MSSALFDTINVVKNDHSIVSVSQLPTVSELRRRALAAPFVLRYDAKETELGGAYEAHKYTSSCQGPAETVASTAAPGALSPAVADTIHAILEMQWPSHLEEWPLCQVSCLWLARPAVRRVPGSAHATMSAPLGYGELLCTSRWEVVGTVFALERYQLVRIPLTTESAWACWQEAAAASPRPGSPSASTGESPTVVVWGNDLTQVHAGAASSPASSRSSTLGWKPSFLGRSPLESVTQASRASIECTVCRFLSTAEGEPPVPYVAAQRLLGLTDAALRKCFFGTCVPLLGASQEERRLRWQKTQLDNDANRSFSPCSNMEVDNSGLHELGGDGLGGTNRSGASHGRISLSTDTSDLAVHWHSGSNPDGAIGVNSSTTSAQTPPQDRSRRPRTSDEGRSLMTPSRSQRGSGPCCGSSTPAQAMNEAWLGFALGRSNHVVWQLMSMPSLFEMNYFGESGEGWRRWREVCGGGIDRTLIVNSLDEIVDYCACSRRAFYSAVACLDRFVAMTRDPTENCRAYLRAIGAPDTTPINMDRLVTFFTQVITVCAMLGCKNTDLYPPHVNKVLLCLKPTMRLTLSDFDALELHILDTIHFDVQPVTLDSVVDLLLYACGTDEFMEGTVEMTHYADLFEHTRSGEQYLTNNFNERLRDAQASMQARRRRQTHLRATLLGPVSADGVASAVCEEARVEEDVWDSFRQFARFLCDQLIRGCKGVPAAATSPEDTPRPEQMAILENFLWLLPPVVLGVGVVVVAAEVFSVPLPAPLFWLLPEAYQLGLQSKDLSPNIETASASLATIAQAHVDDDDARTILKYYVTLLHHAAADMARSHDSADLGSSRASTSGSRARETIGSAIGVVQQIYKQRCGVPCDKPLLKRYQVLFKKFTALL